MSASKESLTPPFQGISQTLVVAGGGNSWAHPSLPEAQAPALLRSRSLRLLAQGESPAAHIRFVPNASPGAPGWEPDTSLVTVPLAPDLFNAAGPVLDLLGRWSDAGGGLTLHLGSGQLSFSASVGAPPNCVDSAFHHAFDGVQPLPEAGEWTESAARFVATWARLWLRGNLNDAGPASVILGIGGPLFQDRGATPLAVGAEMGALLLRTGSDARLGGALHKGPSDPTEGLARIDLPADSFASVADAPCRAAVDAHAIGWWDAETRGGPLRYWHLNA